MNRAASRRDPSPLSVLIGGVAGFLIACVCGWSTWPPSRHDLIFIGGLVAGALVGRVLHRSRTMTTHATDGRA